MVNRHPLKKDMGINQEWENSKILCCSSMLKSLQDYDLCILVNLFIDILSEKVLLWDNQPNSVFKAAWVQQLLEKRQIFCRPNLSFLMLKLLLIEVLLNELYVWDDLDQKKTFFFSLRCFLPCCGQHREGMGQRLIRLNTAQSQTWFSKLV